MSATPIPRSLMMGLYGDMDISILNEKPKNRLEITTSIMSNKKSSELYQSMLKVIDRGEKIYWICPAIEENEELNLISVESKFNELQKIFGEKNIAIIHGKMKESQKEQVMQDFANPNGDSKILVATTVIEVGVDVAQATVIIIENSENFGLAQLHQLRGRVGRSDKKSFCILLYGEKFGAKQKQRLSILRESNDGFFIAEEDLKLRGSGELIGTRQSGFPEFQIADLNFDSDLLKISHQQVSIILNNDKFLLSENNKKYQYLMKLFGYSEFLTLVKSG
jgi:ATP-dependent DNA helicase RecG